MFARRNDNPMVQSVRDGLHIDLGQRQVLLT